MGGDLRASPKHGPLTIPQNPRRNHYGPMRQRYRRRYPIRGEVLVLSVFGFGITLDIAVCLLFGKVITLIVELFTAADTQLQLDPRA